MWYCSDDEIRQMQMNNAEEGLNEVKEIIGRIFRDMEEMNRRIRKVEVKVMPEECEACRIFLELEKAKNALSKEKEKVKNLEHSNKILSESILSEKDRAEKAEKERDAAVEQLRGDCEKCANYKVTWNGCTPDFECPLSDRCLNRDMWEWNGGQKEE